MSVINTVKCDVCGTVKREANKWWILGFGQTFYTVVPAHVSTGISAADQNLDICSEACLMKQEQTLRYRMLRR